MFCEVCGCHCETDRCEHCLDNPELCVRQVQLARSYAEWARAEENYWLEHLYAYMKSPGSQVFGNFQVSWRRGSWNRLNIQLLREQEPELHAHYSERVESDRVYIDPIAV